MFLAVPLLIKCRIAQPKIRREVDDFRTEFRVFLDMMLCLSMRLARKSTSTGSIAAGSLNLSCVRLRRFGWT